MNTNAHPTSPVAGLLSLMADAMDPDSATATTTEVTAIERIDLTSVLGEVVRGWLSVKEDGHAWLLVQFAPTPDHESGNGAGPESTSATGRDLSDGQSTAVAEPTPERASISQRAHRVAFLTDREREVLALVADGATNCAIAKRLFISPKTASVHVSRILTKLDASTRTEAAAVAHAAGLVHPWGSASAGSARTSGLRMVPRLVNA
jgi:DNA-binding CsgD family transcriptional regulator